MEETKQTFKESKIAAKAHKHGFNTHTARKAAKKPRRRRKVCEKIIDDTIENYIKGKDFEYDWSALTPKERVQLALDYSLRLKNGR